MTGDTLPFPSREYFCYFALLLFARGMDFLSTWVATPHLTLEGNPLARKLGWKWGAVVNLALCCVFAFWPLTAVIVITAGLLVAAHNFHSAWLMRSMGEAAYRDWFLERIAQTPRLLYFACLCGETMLTALPGAALIWFGESDSIPFAIGYGIVGYAAIVLFYTSLSLWRLRRRNSNERANCD
jgi:integral membrane sensor domain MASE1